MTFWRQAIATLGMLSAAVLAESTAFAQSPAVVSHSFEDLATTVRRGDSILVTTSEGRIEGALLDLRASTLVLEVAETEERREVAAAQVLRIVRQDSVKDGFGAGFLAGVGIAIVVPLVTGHGPDCGSDSFAAVIVCSTLYLGGIGAAGGGIGAAIDSRVTRTIFAAPGGVAHASIVPIVARQRAGVGLAVRF